MAEGARSDGRLPLTILGGFLGAGKSTWLRHQLHQGRFRDHAILVNEAAETPVDNLLLAGALRLGVLAGGCACCTGQAALVAALRALCNDASGAEAGRIGGVLLETSGLADPGRIAAAIAADPVLSRRLALRETLVLVDGLHGARQLADEGLARAQIEAADALILTKGLGVGIYSAAIKKGALDQAGIDEMMCSPKAAPVKLRFSITSSSLRPRSSAMRE